MRRDRITRAIPAIGLGLALAYTSTASAQGLPPSSGSGAGTGTGMSSGFPGSTGGGRESGGGLGSTGTGREGMTSSPLGPALPNPNLTRPMDRRYNSGPVGVGGLSTVSPDLFLDARSVANPGERALALIRIAQTAIFSRQRDDAHTALFEASDAALLERTPLIREQRLTAIIEGLLLLAEDRMSDYSDPDVGSVDDLMAPPPTPSISPGLPTPTPSPTPAPSPSQTPPALPPSTAEGRTPAVALPETTRKARLQPALTEWAKAVELARRIETAAPRTESLYRIVESQAFSSYKLVTDAARINTSSGMTVRRPEPAKLPADLRSYTDGLLLSASQHASLIERPIWRNYASQSIIANAAASSQFARGFQIARAIDQPEARTDALIQLAEGQALNGRPEEATAAYNEAARSVALIPQEDPRETLVGVLIDSLISFGRFDDARLCVPLYSFPSRQLVALSAVAESQGRRGLAESARLWISREAPPAFRPLLYRKVNDGILASIEQNRSKDLSARGQ